MTDLRTGLLKFGYAESEDRLNNLVNLLKEWDFAVIENLQHADFFADECVPDDGRCPSRCVCVCAHCCACLRYRFGGQAHLLERLDIWEKDFEFLDSVIVKLRDDEDRRKRKVRLRRCRLADFANAHLFSRQRGRWLFHPLRPNP